MTPQEHQYALSKEFATPAQMHAGAQSKLSLADRYRLLVAPAIEQSDKIERRVLALSTQAGPETADQARRLTRRRDDLRDEAQFWDRAVTNLRTDAAWLESNAARQEHTFAPQSPA